MADHRKVVADHQVGQPAIRPQVGQQVQDFRLHRHVQRRGRLVQQQKLGFPGQGPGDGDALALAARQLVGIAEAEAAPQPNVVQQPHDPAVDVVHPLQGQRLGQHAVHRVAGVQAGIGVLEDHLHAAVEGRAAAGARQGFARDLDPARPVGGKARDGPQDRGLARPGLAHQPEAFAAAHPKVHAAHGIHPVGRMAEPDAQILYRQDGRGHRRPPGRASVIEASTSGPSRQASARSSTGRRSTGASSRGRLFSRPCV